MPVNQRNPRRAKTVLGQLLEYFNTVDEIKESNRLRSWSQIQVLVVTNGVREFDLGSQRLIREFINNLRRHTIS